MKRYTIHGLSVLMAAVLVTLSGCKDKSDTISIEETEVTSDPNGMWFNTKVNSSGDWTATTTADWITMIKGTGTSGADLSLRVKANTSGDPRETVVTLVSGDAQTELKIYQKRNLVLYLSSEMVTIDETGGEFSIEMSTNLDCTVEIPSDCSWLKQVETKGVVTSTLKFSVEENTGKDDRTAVVTLSDASENYSSEFVVYQNGVSRILTFVFEGTEVTAPMFSGPENTTVMIDWGDGKTQESAVSQLETHTYEEYGVYTVTVSTRHDQYFTFVNMTGISGIDMSDFTD